MISLPLRDLGLEGIAPAVADLADHGAATLIIGQAALPADLPPPLPDEIEEASYLGQGRAAGFLARRQILRRILADWRGRDPATFGINRSQSGAPIIETSAGAPLFCSFSARGDIGVIGLAIAPIGVDVEAMVPHERIPWNMLLAAEQDVLRRLPPEAAARQFTRLWTTKEATVKALGAGFAIPPEAIRLWEDGSAPSLLSPFVEQFPAISGATLLTWQDVTVFKARGWDYGADGAGGLAVAAVLLKP